MGIALTPEFVFIFSGPVAFTSPWREKHILVHYFKPFFVATFVLNLWKY